MLEQNTVPWLRPTDESTCMRLVTEEHEIFCPFCGENISIVVDASVQEQNYTEDCEVCCSPIDIRLQVLSDDNISIDVRRENE